MADVLIVDDDDDIRLTLRMFLEEMSAYTVWDAADGVSGLAHIRASERPLVVLLDWRMPRLGGLGVLEAVAQDASLATRHAFILITMSQQAAQMDFLARMGLRVTHIPKPFDLSLLLLAVVEAERRLPGAATP